MPLRRLNAMSYRGPDRINGTIGHPERMEAQLRSASCYPKRAKKMAAFCRNRYLDCRSVAAVVLGSMAILRSYGRAWRDRVVVVTGGTSGIGREFALRLAAEGAKVIACARNEVALRELHTRFPQIEAIRCDVTVTPDVLALEAAIQDRYGRVDVLINNAGIMEQVDLLDRSVSDERIAQEIAVNLTGPIC